MTNLKYFICCREIIKKQERNLSSSPFTINAITHSNIKLHLSLCAKHLHLTHLNIKIKAVLRELSIQHYKF